MLTQAEADALIALQKKRKRNEVYTFPPPGRTLSIPIISLDGKEDFLIDVNRGQIRLTKCSYQERYETTNILLRLDIDGARHTNPEVLAVPLLHLAPYNGRTIDCPHLHLYVEGFMDKWAIPAPQDKFTDTTNLYTSLQDFFRYCNIIEIPTIQSGLF